MNNAKRGFQVVFRGTSMIETYNLDQSRKRALFESLIDKLKNGQYLNDSEKELRDELLLYGAKYYPYLPIDEEVFRRLYDQMKLSCAPMTNQNTNIIINGVIVNRQYKRKSDGRIYKVNKILEKTPDGDVFQLSHTDSFSTIYTTATLEELGRDFEFYDPSLDILPEEQAANEPFQDEGPCDCGGLKTHGSMEAAYHSTWCKSRRSI